LIVGGSGVAGYAGAAAAAAGASFFSRVKALGAQVEFRNLVHGQLLLDY
jgi:hypothetical protein